MEKLMKSTHAIKVLRFIANNNKVNKVYSLKMARGLGITNSYMAKLLKVLKSYNLIESEEKGRIKFLAATNKGKQIAEHFEKINYLLNE